MRMLAAGKACLDPLVGLDPLFFSVFPSFCVPLGRCRWPAPGEPLQQLLKLPIRSEKQKIAHTNLARLLVPGLNVLLTNRQVYSSWDAPDGGDDDDGDERGESARPSRD